MVVFIEKICIRFMYIYGVNGEMYVDSFFIIVNDFRMCKKMVYYLYVFEGGGYGDGDEGLMC